MRKVIVILSLLCLLAPLAQAKETKYGEGVSSRETMAVSTLLASPDDYVGKTVRVQGLAVGVCKHRGCWINIASDVEGESVRLKVQDGVIVFPPEIVGETVIAEGVWTANQLDLDQTKQICAYEAEKAGKDFDPDEVTVCKTLYQITGTGAVVVEQVEAKAADKPHKG